MLCLTLINVKVKNNNCDCLYFTVWIYAEYKTKFYPIQNLNILRLVAPNSFFPDGFYKQIIDRIS